MYSSTDTIREQRSGYHPDGPDASPPSPSAMTPRTAEKVSRAQALGAALRRYAIAAVALVGSLGLGGVTAAAGQSPGEWVQRYGFWGALGLLALSAAEAHRQQNRTDGAASIAALERRAEAAERYAAQQVELLEARADAREQRSQEVIELIMDRHALALGELRDEVRAGRDEVRELRNEVRAITPSPDRRRTLPPTPPAGKG